MNGGRVFEIITSGASPAVYKKAREKKNIKSLTERRISAFQFVLKKENYGSKRLLRDFGRG